MTSATSDAATTTGAKQNKQRRAAISRGVSTLMYASQQGDVDRVRKIIGEQSSTLLNRDRTGKTPLHYCCTSDNICAAQAADVLVMAAPDLVESRDEDGFTPLHLAVIAGNMPLVTFLLANKADVNAVDNEKHTVVHWATVCGETAALRAVLAAGAPVSTPDVHGGYPLHYAAQMCGGERDSNLGIQVLQTLLTHTDIIVHVEDGDGRQPLLWAASAGSAKALLALIRAGATVEASDKDGLTALHCAASRGHTDCIDSLLTLCGASPDVIDSNGCTALHYSVTLGHADATALLLAHGADPNRQDRKGRSPAHCGCAKGQFETVKMIGAQGANLWLRNARGDLPLHEAAASGRRDLVRWLLDMRPSQVNARNNDGRCPLHLAALNDNADMCKILLDAGAQVNPVLRTSKNTFMTPLDCALQRGFRSTAKFLQLHGGVPANRLGDQRQIQTQPGSRLQTKEDATVWPNTSSDSERENGETTKFSKKIQRKKLSNKFERKRASLSGSDIENNKLDNNRRRRFNQKTRASVRSDSAASSDVPKRPSTRVEYTNEIVINGKTEININNTRQINIGDEEVATKLPSKLSAEIAEKVLSETEKRPKSAEKVFSEKRPKSAEKVPSDTDKRPISVEKAPSDIEKRPKSAKGSAKKRTKVDKPNSIQKQNNLKQSKETEKSEIIETKETETHTTKLQKSADEQSLMSNTSEDVEEHRNLVVEAAIHEPPKETEKDQETEEKADQEIVKKEAEQEPNIDRDTSVQEDNQNKEEVVENVEQTENMLLKADSSLPQEENSNFNQDEIQKELKNEDVINNLASEEKEVHVEFASTENDNAKIIEKEQNVEEISEKISDVKEIISEKTEISEEISDVKEIIAEKTEISKEISDVREIIAEKTEISEMINEVPSELAAIKTDIPDEVETKTLDAKIELEGKLVDETKQEQSVEETKVDENKQPDVSDKVDVEMPVQEQEKTKLEEKESTTVKPKKKDSRKKKSSEEIIETTDEKKDPEMTEAKETKFQKKSHRKKHQTPEDQAYEIIYKTLGAEDIEETTERQDKRREKLKQQKPISESKSSDEYSTDLESESSTSTSLTVKEHKSFRILDDQEAEELETKKTKPRRLRSPPKKQRSRSEETKKTKSDKKRSKIPLSKTHLSKSDKYLNIPDRKHKLGMESRVPSLPNINETKVRVTEFPRSDSNMSAPLPVSMYSDKEVSASDFEQEERSSATRRKKVKRKSKTREARSAGSDYESSNVIDSGFEPSPRSSKIPKWKNMSERGVNMTSVTQSIQTNIRRYHLERKIFQHLLDLKRLQIRAGQHNEAILVKRAIDAYHQSCASTVGAGRYLPEDYTFRSFEKFLYLSLRKLQRNGADHMKGLPESPANPLLCTQSTHRCMHATHAYTGIPCAAYLPKMDHHTIPKIGFMSTQCKPGTGFLPTINQKKAVTLELCHGNDKQLISLPADRLDQNKRYYVTFTVKGSENTPPNEESTTSGHRHSKSD